MIYKVIAAAAVLTPAQALYKRVGDNTGSAGDFDRIRGASYVATALSDTLSMHYTTTAGSVFGTAATTVSTITTPNGAASFSEQDVAVGQDEGGAFMFTSQTNVAAISQMEVLYYRGDYSAWSVQQYLRPPAEFNEQNNFGKTLSLDRYDNSQLAVGCPGCNSSYTGSGTVYVYEPESPSAKKWVRKHALTPTGTDIFSPGSTTLSIHKDTLATSYVTGTSVPKIVLFAKDKGKWEQAQDLSTIVASDVSVYDQTVVVGSSTTAAYTALGGSVVGTVNILYPNKPGPKPRPTQWSVQQVLVQPDTSGTNHRFGSAVSIDGNRLAVSAENDATLYLYERQESHGMWSLQQRINAPAPAVQNGLVLSGSSLLLSTIGSSTHLYDETEQWDCLIVSVEDHFNDGWDTANLVVDVPGGDKDSFTSRCDLKNPFQFRYCPASKGDAGLYRFSMPDAVKAKFHWEIIWRVYEESSGEWFTGNWGSRMDFEWDSNKAQFSHKKMDRLLPNNITCKECRQKPQPKPKGLRSLKGKDSTHAPTVSPAPTVDVTNSHVAWQELALVTQGKDWFDAQHKGTSYYISDKSGHRLLSTGTLCPWELNPSTKTCWEEYPDGDYILRVGGALDRDTTHTFRFCKATNDMTQESQLLFRVTNGDCEIRSLLQSSSVCSRDIGVVQVATATISIQGVSGSFGATEKSHVASAVASVLSGIDDSDITVTSVANRMGTLEVNMQVKAHGNRLGLNLADPEVLDAFEANVLHSLQSSEGAMLTALVSSDRASSVHSATRVTFDGFRLTGQTEAESLVSVSADEVVNMADGESARVSSSSDKSTFNALNALSVAGYVLAAAGVVALVGFFVVSRASAPQALPQVEMTIAVEEEPRSRPAKSSISGRVLTPSDLRELVSSVSI